MIFNSGYGTVFPYDMDKRTANEIEDEPMLFRADLDFALANGGPITQEFLKQVTKIWGNENLIIDSRSHMLMRGWYPCIPGWHHDDVARSGPSGQPDYDNMPYESKHIASVIDASDKPTGSLTQFWRGTIDLGWPVPDDVNVYQYWDEILSSKKDIKPERIPSRAIVLFDWQTFHRGTPARWPGWRFFIRCTKDTEVKAQNKIRKNANVYLPCINRGW